ncbi:MAG: mechanosensitive ion channel family protein [Desulfobacterales bacterium]|nr:mechanosensitive ion channel family protein [Desulfobacterales bacterium]
MTKNKLITIMKKYYKLFLSIFFTIIFLSIKPMLDLFSDHAKGLLSILYNQNHILVTIGISWFLIVLIRTLKTTYLKKFDISEEDNLASRKVYTQINLLEKILIFVIILFAIGIVLLSFDSIRKIGIGLFASAGLAGIIIGLSAQKVVGSLLAGIQIAITQPFRIDDAVLVENEWGWIEEINLTYVVVRIWDKRRLVLPSTYFLEKPFQNWTRTSAEIVGSVFIYADYTISFQAMRDELSRLLNESELWNKNVKVLQVTDSKESTVEIRILVSAKNSPTAWDLRVYIREKMIEFIQKNYPESLPRTRVALEKDKSTNTQHRV